MRSLEIASAMKFPGFFILITVFAIFFAVAVMSIMFNVMTPCIRAEDFDDWVDNADVGDRVIVVGVIESERDDNYRLEGSDTTIDGLFDDLGDEGEKVAIEVHISKEGNIYGDDAELLFFIAVIDIIPIINPFQVVAYGFLIPAFFILPAGIALFVISILIERNTLKKIQDRPVPHFGAEKDGVMRNLDTNEYQKGVIEKLDINGFQFRNVLIGRYPALVATARDFKWGWGGVFRNFYIIITKMNHADRFTIEDFSGMAFKFAISDYKGLRRGFQSGVMCYPVILSEGFQVEGIRWVNNNLRRHYAAMEIPVLINPRTNEIFYSRKVPIWGYLTYPQLRMFIEKYFRFVPEAKCPHCGNRSNLRIQSKVSMVGWITFLIYFFILAPTVFLWPVAFMGLSMKRYYYACPYCEKELTF